MNSTKFQNLLKNVEDLTFEQRLTLASKIFFDVEEEIDNYGQIVFYTGIVREGGILREIQDDDFSSKEEE